MNGVLNAKLISSKRPVSIDADPRASAQDSGHGREPNTYTKRNMVMDKTQENALLELLDRQAILDCIYRYCRGVDRFDRDLVLSAYHPDATDAHGEFTGSPQGFVEWAFGYHKEHQLSHHHMILNHSCELDGDIAHTESYWIFMAENRTKPNTLAVGRYIDRMEKREGRWAIADRICVTESVNDIDPSDIPEETRAYMQAYGPSERGRTDVSYERPLLVRHPYTSPARGSS